MQISQDFQPDELKIQQILGFCEGAMQYMRFTEVYNLKVVLIWQDIDQMALPRTAHTVDTMGRRSETGVCMCGEGVKSVAGGVWR